MAYIDQILGIANTVFEQFAFRGVRAFDVLDLVGAACLVGRFGLVIVVEFEVRDVFEICGHRYALTRQFVVGFQWVYVSA